MDTGALADRLAAEARELWSHVPPGIEPSDDANLAFGTHPETGRLQVRHQNGRAVDIWELRGVEDGNPAAFRTRYFPNRTEWVQAWRHCQPIGEAEITSEGSQSRGDRPEHHGADTGHLLPEE